MKSVSRIIAWSQWSSKSKLQWRDCASQYDSSPTGSKSDRAWGDKEETTTKKRKNSSHLLDEIDLAGLEECKGDEQKDDQELITEYASIFAMSDMD